MLTTSTKSLKKPQTVTKRPEVVKEKIEEKEDKTVEVAEQFIKQYYDKVDETIKSRPMMRTGSDGSKVKLQPEMMVAREIKR